MSIQNIAAISTNPQTLRIEAQCFVDDVRAHMVEFRNPVGGPKGFSSKKLADIAARSFDTVKVSNDNNGLRDCFNQKSGQKALEKIILNFEVFCHRQKIEIPFNLKPELSKLFLEELACNAQIFEYEDEAEKISSLTLNQGIGCIDIMQEEEFFCFRDTLGIYRRAAVGNPKDPRGFLRGVIQVIDELEQDKEFSCFRDSPGIYRHVAANNPKDPRGFLRGVIQVIGELEQDKEFSCFRDMPGIYKRIAVNTSKDPRGALRQVIQVIGELEQEEEFSSFRDTSWIYRYVAVANPKDPREALRRIMSGELTLSYFTITEKWDISNGEEPAPT